MQIVSTCLAFNFLICCDLILIRIKKEGESFLVVWNESEGSVKRTYLGPGNWYVGVVRFDTTNNMFLAAGDEFPVNFFRYG
ncbi:hypothetical protein RND81_11G002400 [Saponaria officinalis]|uniref:Uncharacterized protein n=1 Tax=Saponaria officinalis TaxID=3572 RepID=A0AAW1HGE9_SAPOF